MSALQDQYDMGRIPLRPLEYINKDLAFTGELLIDSVSGNGSPSYHLYLADPEDKNKFIDLTNIVVNEISNSDGVSILIEGLDKPILLTEIISYIYNRFIGIDNPRGFSKETDMDHVTNIQNLNMLLKLRGGERIFPVTRTTAVFDTKGVCLQDRLDNMTRVGFANDYIIVEYDDQSSFTIQYPFMNYPNGGNYMELRIGTVYIDKSRYNKTELTDEESNIYGCQINFFKDTFQAGRRIDILYIYNTYDVENSDYNAIDGHQLANYSIDISKLSKVSDSFTSNDNQSLATSKALYDLYCSISSLVAGSESKVIYARDSSGTNPNVLTVNMANDKTQLDSSYKILNVLLEYPKYHDFRLDVIYQIGGTGTSVKSYDISLDHGIGSNRLIRFLISDSFAKVLEIEDLYMTSSRYIYIAKDAELDISFKDLQYSSASLIKIYRNGVRLFENLDYNIDMTTQLIHLYNRTEEGEKIVFEAETLSH